MPQQACSGRAWSQRPPTHEETGGLAHVRLGETRRNCKVPAPRQPPHCQRPSNSRPPLCALQLGRPTYNTAVSARRLSPPAPAPSPRPAEVFTVRNECMGTPGAQGLRLTSTIQPKSKSKTKSGCLTHPEEYRASPGGHAAWKSGAEVGRAGAIRSREDPRHPLRHTPAPGAALHRHLPLTQDP